MPFNRVLLRQERTSKFWYHVRTRFIFRCGPLSKYHSFWREFGLNWPGIGPIERALVQVMLPVEQ